MQKERGRSWPGDITQSVREIELRWMRGVGTPGMFGTDTKGRDPVRFGHTEACNEASAGSRHLCNATQSQDATTRWHNEWPEYRVGNLDTNNYPPRVIRPAHHTDPGQYWELTHFTASPPSRRAGIHQTTLGARWRDARLDVTFTIRAPMPARRLSMAQERRCAIAGGTQPQPTSLVNYPIVRWRGYSVVITNTSGGSPAGWRRSR